MAASAAEGAIVPFHAGGTTSEGTIAESAISSLTDRASYMRYLRRVNSKKVQKLYPDLVKRFNDPSQRM